jgi:dihydrofolate reductase
MGCDIHGVFQKQDSKTKTWEDVESKYEGDRHYQLFAVLAGVRNGYGFAGCPIGDAVKPISEPRGFPRDFVLDAVNDQNYVCHRGMWMGDHSHSWLTGKQLLKWYTNACTVTKTGILDREVYEAWDKKSFPTSYCGGIDGPRIVVVKDTEKARKAQPQWTHIRCTWKSSLKDELKYFFDEVQRLQTKYGNIRFVFGFDN